jgi:putative transposase
MNKKHTHSKHCVYNISYHIVWIPKYRRKILINNVEKRLKELLILKANQLNINIKAIECMPDHIHLFIKASPSIPVIKIIKHLKGYSSKILRAEFSELCKMRSLWTPSYFCESIGNINEKTIIKYINNQKK